jgi:uncharacterized protein (DUF58 family)
MDFTAPKPALTTLLSNDLLGRVERLRIQSSRKFTARHRGEHLAGRGGASTEFSDYRDYAAGDDLRFVDWNIFSRLHRPYLKLFRLEEEMHVVLLVDGSSSMLFEGKFERARQLSAALGVMGLLGGERVSVCVSGRSGAAPAYLPPRTGRAGMARFFGFLESAESGGDSPVDDAVDGLLKRFRGRGVAILLSDFLTFGDLTKAFNRLYSSGLETWAIQLLGPTELNPQLASDARLIDVETGEALDVSAAGDLLTLYEEYRLGYEQMLEGLCRKRGGRFLTVASDRPAETVVLEDLRRKGWVR